MPKRRNVQASKSPFADLVKLNQQPEAATVMGLPATGRTRGKSANPEFIKLTSYIRRETHLAVKKRLLDDGGREISELIEELLGKWLARHGQV